jgi:ribose transport system ATP-binding protein
MHELGKALFGMMKPEAGRIVYCQDRKEIPITSPQIAIKNHIAYVSKNRDQEGLMLTSSIGDNIVLPGVNSLAKATFLSPFAKRSYAERNTRQLSVKMNNISQLVMYLSGGNKQKVSISKWLANQSEVFILDCPTRGIDVSVKAAVYQLMQDFKTQGRSVIMISEELLELIGMCDRVFMMRNGKISGKVARSAEMTEENLIHMMV